LEADVPGHVDTTAQLSTIEPELSLTKYLGGGGCGIVYFADAGYAVKLAQWQENKDMLRHEAAVYQSLLPLQGICIPKLYGLFGSECVEALVLQFMGCSLDSIEELNVEQR
jgi:hypothetical protein